MQKSVESKRVQDKNSCPFYRQLGLPDFSCHNVPKRWKIYQIAAKLPNVHKIKNCQRLYQTLPIQGPHKFTQIGIFGLKIYHLATL
jgi:hypothetical protein